MTQTSDSSMDFLSSPLTIAGRTVANRLWLSPMAGLGHIAFRELLDEFGNCGLMFTEMCTGRGLPQERRETSPSFCWRDEELPRLVCQIVGNDPKEMAEAARRIADEGFFGVDINMGCSASSIVKRRAGADLLRKHRRATRMVKAIRDAVDIPVFVKFRSGWERDLTPTIRLAKYMEDAGADCFVFHPRMAPDRRTRPPMLDHIRQIKEAVSIPVLGNGNVCLPADATHMLEKTGCDGISIGRMGVAAPWLYSQWLHGTKPEPNQYLRAGLRMCDLLEKWYDPTRAIKRYKKYAVYLAANFLFGHTILPKLIRGHDIPTMRSNLWRVLGPLPQTTDRPNNNLFTY